MICPNCRMKLPDENKFCPSCYSDLKPNNAMNEPPKVDSKYKSEYIDKSSQKEIINKNEPPKVDPKYKSESFGNSSVNDRNGKRADQTEANENYSHVSDSDGEVIFCYKCGKKIISGALFCSNCGTKQNDTGFKDQFYHDDAIIKTKRRHGFLSFILWLQLIGQIVILIAYLFGFDFKPNSLENIILFGSYSSNFNYIFSVLLIPILEITSITLLLNWKKYGFILYIISNIISLIISPKTGFLGQSLIFLPILWLLLIFALLQLKKDGVSAWNNLKW